MRLDNKPLVSVCCITYNHENYIRDAIESFLMQKVTFPLEIVIHDDHSSDNTAEIVKEYADKYPCLIIPILQSVNQYSLGIKPFSGVVFQRARGKYIAICEGDDYWIDPYKLQKQVDFMEQNTGFGLVHGDCHFYYQESKQWLNYANNNLINKLEGLSKEQIFQNIVSGEYKIRTATVLFKKELLEKRAPDIERFEMGDTPMWLDFSQMTRFKYLDEVFSVYRILSNSASRSTNIKKQTRFSLSMAEMRIYYSKKHCYTIDSSLKNRYNKALLNYKVYEPDYKERVPLLDPTGYQKFKFEILSSKLFQKLFLNNAITRKVVYFTLNRW